MRATALVLLLAAVAVILAAPAVTAEDNATYSFPPEYEFYKHFLDNTTSEESSSTSDAFTEYVLKHNVTLISILNGSAENLSSEHVEANAKGFVHVVKKLVYYLTGIVKEGFSAVVAYIKAVFYAIILFAKGAITIVMFFVNIAVLAVKTLTSWGINIVSWLPYILMTALVLSFADAINRMYRSKSIFPLQQMVSAWSALIGKCVAFLHGIYSMLKDWIENVKTIAEFCKTVWQRIVDFFKMLLFIK